jgi:hypothetical protein
MRLFGCVACKTILTKSRIANNYRKSSQSTIKKKGNPGRKALVTGGSLMCLDSLQPLRYSSNGFNHGMCLLKRKLIDPHVWMSSLTLGVLSWMMFSLGSKGYGLFFYVCQLTA